MTIADWLFTTFEARETHELPTKMMERLLDDEKRYGILESYRQTFSDLTHDYLRDFFQDSAADRKALKQDYTPDSICQIVAHLAGKPERCLDMCAGTGALTIGVWKESPQTEFICMELSTMAVPFLLLNLSVRGIEATVVQGDVLTEEIQTIYELEDGKITTKPVESYKPQSFPIIITNPPYSLKWDGEPRKWLEGWETPPKSKADFAFVLKALSMLQASGKLVSVLPHGVLFRGASEGKIRKRIIEKDFWSTIVGLPSNLFQETSIPVQISVFEKSDDLHFIDASNLFTKVKKQNLLEPEHIETIKKAIDERGETERLSHLASLDEIAKNDYNLNAPRYIDITEPEPEIDIVEVTRELIRCEQEQQRLTKEITAMILELESTIGDPAWKEAQDLWREYAKMQALL